MMSEGGERLSNVHKRMTTSLLTSAAVLLALPCAYFLYRVAERCVAAGWMAYKFHGYSEEVYVASSQSTAYLAIGVVMYLALVASPWGVWR